jgi:hypothetical protein
MAGIMTFDARTLFREQPAVTNLRPRGFASATIPRLFHGVSLARRQLLFDLFASGQHAARDDANTNDDHEGERVPETREQPMNCHTSF